MGRLLSCALPAGPTDQPSLPFTVPTHCKTDEMSAGGAGYEEEGWGRRAVGISALPWTAHVCSQQAGVLPWRKEPSGEELAQDWSCPTCILAASTDATFTTYKHVPISLTLIIAAALLFKLIQAQKHECFVCPPLWRLARSDFNK